MLTFQNKEDLLRHAATSFVLLRMPQQTEMKCRIELLQCWQMKINFLPQNNDKALFAERKREREIKILKRFIIWVLR